MSVRGVQHEGLVKHSQVILSVSSVRGLDDISVVLFIHVLR